MFPQIAWFSAVADYKVALGKLQDHGIKCPLG